MTISKIKSNQNFVLCKDEFIGYYDTASSCKQSIILENICADMVKKGIRENLKQQDSTFVLIQGEIIFGYIKQIG